MALTVAEKKRRQRERDAANGFEHISLKVRREHKGVLLSVVSVLNEGVGECGGLPDNEQVKGDAMNEISRIDTRNAVSVEDRSVKGARLLAHLQKLGDILEASGLPDDFLLKEIEDARRERTEREREKRELSPAT